MGKTVFVIIPVFNCKEYLAHAVESVLHQPYAAISIVLVNDGSTDGSAALCDQLCAAHSQVYVVHKPNGGVSSARNAGLDFVYSQWPEVLDTGYIAFLDADDAWFPSFFTPENIALLEQGYDLLCFQTCVCNHDLSRCYISPPHKKCHSGGCRSVWLHAGHFGAVLYRAAFLQTYGLRFYLIPMSEDKIFLMQSLFLAEKICQSPGKLYMYRQNIKSAIHNRATGIPYFNPIIDSYLKSDADMSVWSNDVRGTLSAGNVLAQIYVMDMIEEHFQNWGTREQIIDYLRSRPDYLDVVQSSVGGPAMTARLDSMKRHPTAMILKNRLYGMAFRMIRRIYHIKPIKFIADLRRFPVKIDSL